MRFLVTINIRTGCLGRGEPWSPTLARYPPNVKGIWLCVVEEMGRHALVPISLFRPVRLHGWIRASTSLKKKKKQWARSLSSYQYIILACNLTVACTLSHTRPRDLNIIRVQVSSLVPPMLIGARAPSPHPFKRDVKVCGGKLIRI